LYSKYINVENVPNHQHRLPSQLPKC
jgi:hypothetical protein